jgi:4-carboxymuconolactone decarboxylase
MSPKRRTNAGDPPAGVAAARVEAPASSPARLAVLLPRELDQPQRAVYDAIAGGRRAHGPQPFRLTDDEGGLLGPFNAFLLQPRVGGPLQALGSAIRYDTDLSDRAREIAILVVAAHWRSEFEWYAHERVGREAGLTSAELEAISRGAYTALPEDERVLAETAALLASEADLDDAAYRQAVEVMGQAGLFELTTLVGYYALLALQLKVFRVKSPGG